MRSIKLNYILTLDEGTTSARAIIFDLCGKPVCTAQHEFTQIYPAPGLVEHDPKEILSCQMRAVDEVIENSGVSIDDIAAVGITNQRETTVVWDKNTGEPVYNAIVWQCRRTADICEKLKKDGYEDYIAETTGLKCDAYFSGTKIKWILDNVPGAREKAERGELLFGTVDTWLLWNITGKKVHATDYTNASRTMLFDINRLCWDKKMQEVLGIPCSMLPEVKKSGSFFGNMQIRGKEIPVFGIAGDQQSSLFGQKCFSAGDVKNTYGTGCFLLMNTGEKPFKSKCSLVTTLAAVCGDAPAQYVLEGSVFIGGAVIQWLRDELRILTNAAESEAAALSIKDNGGVYIVPAFAGLGAPYWDMYARGTICGLTRGSGRAHIIRAALESIAYQTNDLVDAMRTDTSLDISEIKADGGAAENKFLMQFQADVSGASVLKSDCSEATALGAALIAGLSAGLYKSLDEIKALGSKGITYVPTIDESEKAKLLNGWKKAVNSTISFKAE